MPLNRELPLVFFSSLACARKFELSPPLKLELVRVLGLLFGSNGFNVGKDVVSFLFGCTEGTVGMERGELLDTSLDL